MIEIVPWVGVVLEDNNFDYWDNSDFDMDYLIDMKKKDKNLFLALNHFVVDKNYIVILY